MQYHNINDGQTDGRTNNIALCMQSHADWNYTVRYKIPGAQTKGL